MREELLATHAVLNFIEKETSSPGNNASPQNVGASDLESMLPERMF